MPLGLVLLFGLLLLNFFSRNFGSSGTEIWVAKGNLQQGTRVEKSLFEKQTVSGQSQFEAVDDFSLIDGCHTRGPVAKGSGLTSFLLDGNCKLLEVQRDV